MDYAQKDDELVQELALAGEVDMAVGADELEDAADAAALDEEV